VKVKSRHVGAAEADAVNAASNPEFSVVAHELGERTKLAVTLAPETPNPDVLDASSELLQ
jgi:hypothetical protein